MDIIVWRRGTDVWRGAGECAWEEIARMNADDRCKQ